MVKFAVARTSLLIPAFSTVHCAYFRHALQRHARWGDRVVLVRCVACKRQQLASDALRWNRVHMLSRRSSVSSATAIENTWKYVLDVANPLPEVNLTKTLAAHWLPETWQQRLLTNARRHFGHYLVVFNVCGVLMVTSWFVSSSTAAILAPILNFAAIPFTVVSYLLLNRDMLAALCKHFEFWFATVLNVATWVLFALVMGDARASSAVLPCLAMQLIPWFDANFRTLVATAVSGFVWFPAEVCIILICLKTGIENARREHSDHVAVGATTASASESGSDSGNGSLMAKFTTINTLLNVSLTLLAFVSNKLYKRRQLLTRHFALTRMVPFTIYRSRMVLKQMPSSVFEGTRSASSRIHRRSISVSKEPICLIAFRKNVFDIRDTLAPRFNLVANPSRVTLVIVWTCYIGGLITTAGSTHLILNAARSEDDPLLDGMLLGALVFTATFVTPFVLNYQRELLRMLLKMFDFWFITLQFGLGFACLADMLNWDRRSGIPIVWSMWVLWVLLLDALTPPVKARFGLTKRYGAVVMMGILVGILALGFVLFDDTEGRVLKNRAVLLASWGNLRIYLHTQSFLFYRVVTLVIWACRLLYDLAWCPIAQLVLIRGGLEVHDPLDVFPAAFTKVAIEVDIKTSRSSGRARSPSKALVAPVSTNFNTASSSGHASEVRPAMIVSSSSIRSQAPS